MHTRSNSSSLPSSLLGSSALQLALPALLLQLALELGKPHLKLLHLLFLALIPRKIMRKGPVAARAAKQEAMARKAKKAHNRISKEVKMAALQASAEKAGAACLCCLDELAVHLGKRRQLPLLPPLHESYLPQEVMGDLSKQGSKLLDLAHCQLEVSLIK